MNKNIENKGTERLRVRNKIVALSWCIIFWDYFMMLLTSHRPSPIGVLDLGEGTNNIFLFSFLDSRILLDKDYSVL